MQSRSARVPAPRVHPPVIRRWWRWRVELSRLLRLEDRAWRAYARAQADYLAAVAAHGYPGALPEAEEAAQLGREFQRWRQRYLRHLSIDHWRRIT